MNKILIIQDSPSVNMLLKSRLETAGFSVDTAETGEEGIEKARTLHYRLILLDISLPGINGIEVCRILKKEEDIKNIPLVFMSAKGKDELDKIAKETGADDCISISFKHQDLIKKVKGLINEQRKKS